MKPLCTSTIKYAKREKKTDMCPNLVKNMTLDSRSSVKLKKNKLKEITSPKAS